MQQHATLQRPKQKVSPQFTHVCPPFVLGLNITEPVVAIALRFENNQQNLQLAVDAVVGLNVTLAWMHTTTPMASANRTLVRHRNPLFPPLLAQRIFLLAPLVPRSLDAVLRSRSHYLVAVLFVSIFEQTADSATNPH